MNTNLVRDIYELQKSMQNTPTVCTADTFQYLQSIIGPHIKISSDTSSDTPVITRALGTKPFDYLNAKKVNRVILTVDQTRADFTKLLSQQCNGVVFSYPGWDFLSVPSPRFDRKAKLKTLDLKEYNVYTINDGTTVTLYWYIPPNGEGKWCLASSKGMDIGDYRWMGAKTYMQAIMEVAAQYPEFKLDKLNKRMCYTLGFRHHDFHPLLADKSAMWAIQTFDRTNKKLGRPNIGIPVQEPVQLPIQTIGYMMSMNQSALVNYQSKGEIHYGYILKSKIAGKANVIVESELYRYIRRTVYHLTKNPSVTISPDNRAEFVALRAFVYPGNKQTFLAIFPQFSYKFAEYELFFKQVEKTIISKLKNPGLDIKDDKQGCLSKALAAHITKTTKIDPGSESSASIIQDFVKSPAHLPAFLACFTK